MTHPHRRNTNWPSGCAACSSTAPSTTRSTPLMPTRATGSSCGASWPVASPALPSGVPCAGAWRYAAPLRWIPWSGAAGSCAERNSLASLDWARKQQAKSWELRTSASLAKLWQSQNKRKEALELLQPIYALFSEGFDTKDLTEANALLSDLGYSGDGPPAPEKRQVGFGAPAAAHFNRAS